jgi:hypothetical protein
MGKPLDLPALDRLLSRQGLYRPLGAAGTGPARRPTAPPASQGPHGPPGTGGT